MPVKRHQQSSAKKNKIKKNKKKDENERHFQVGYNHNPVKLFWVLRLITFFNVGNNFTTSNASNILFQFSCSLTKVSHGFNTVLLLQIIIYKEVLRLSIKY